jgi:hypothetical protein
MRRRENGERGKMFSRKEEGGKRKENTPEADDEEE